MHSFHSSSCQYRSVRRAAATGHPCRDSQSGLPGNTPRQLQCARAVAGGLRAEDSRRPDAIGVAGVIQQVEEIALEAKIVVLLEWNVLDQGSRHTYAKR